MRLYFYILRNKSFIVSSILLLINIIINKQSPKITVYLDSYSKESANFGSLNFEKLYNTENKYLLYSGIKFIAYGNTTETEESTIDNRMFNCTYGENQCYGNLIEVCSFHLLDDDLKEEYYICFSKQIKNDLNNFYSNLNKQKDAGIDFNSVVKSCAPENLSKYIIDCSTSNLGKELLHEAGIRTKNKLTNLPFFVLNENDFSVEIQNGMLLDTISFLCKYSDLIGKIEICPSPRLEFLSQSNDYNSDVEIEYNTQKRIFNFLSLLK